MPEVFTIEDLATRWNCSSQMVYQMLLNKKLKGFRVGKLWRIPRAEIEKIEKGET